MKIFPLSISVVLLLLIGCSDSTMIENGPGVPGDGNHTEDKAVIAFTIYYPGYSVVAIAPLNNMTAFRLISPPDFRDYTDPRFSPSKTKVLFRDGQNVAYLYDVDLDSTFIPMDNNGDVRIPVQARTRNIVWEPGELTFLFHSGYFGPSEPWDVARYSFSNERIERITKEFALLFSITNQTVVVRGGYPRGDVLAPQVHYFDIESRQHSAIGNHFLHVQSCTQPCSPRIVDGFEWNPELEMIAVTVRETEMEAWTSHVAITDLSGSFVEVLTPSDVRYDNPRWGPNNVLYVDRILTREDYLGENNIQLMMLDVNTKSLKEVIPKSAFERAIGIGTVDL